AVDNAVLVGVGEAREHLDDPGQRRLWVGPQPGLDRALEVRAFEQLEGHERPALVVLAELVDRDDVRVLEPRGGDAFLLEAGPGLRAGRADRHDLERDVALERLVAPAVYDAHGPTTEDALDEIAADPGGSHVSASYRPHPAPARVS